MCLSGGRSNHWERNEYNEFNISPAAVYTDPRILYSQKTRLLLARGTFEVLGMNVMV